MYCHAIMKMQMQLRCAGASVRRCVVLHLPILKQLTITPKVVDSFTEKVDVIVVNFQDYL